MIHTQALFKALLTTIFMLVAGQVLAQCGVNIPDGERCEAPGGTNCEFYICVAGSCQPSGVYYPSGSKCGCFGDECYDDFCDGNGNCNCVLTPAPFGTKCASEQNLCDGLETCDGANGRLCNGPTNFPAAGCDDGVACTNDCNPVDGCVTYPIDAVCDDANPCTIDACDTTGMMVGCNNNCNPIPACANDPACTTFPISLVSFEGETEGLNLRLSWITSFEINNEGFMILMRRPDTDFRQVGWVQGAGSVQEAQLYSFDTELPSPGLYIVKLRQRDIDGNTVDSKVLRFKVESQDFAQLYPPFPNPASGPSVIRFQVRENGFSCLRVFDQQGRAVTTLFEGAAEAGKLYHINISPEVLSQGIYYCHLKTANGVFTQKLIRYEQ